MKVAAVRLFLVLGSWFLVPPPPPAAMLNFNTDGHGWKRMNTDYDIRELAVGGGRDAEVPADDVVPSARLRV